MPKLPTLLASLLLSSLALHPPGRAEVAPGGTKAGALPTPDADNGGLTLPPGFHALVVADKLKPLRNLTVAPNGDIYVKTRESGIYGLRDTDGDGRADVIQEFGSGGGTGIALRGEWLYSSTDDHVFRYKLTPSELVPAGEPQRIVRDLPNQRQHSAKVFAFGADGQLYVETGSPSNAYGGRKDRALGATGEDPAEFLKTHGGYWRYDPDKLEQTQADGYHFSTGHRHSLALQWNPTSKNFFMVQMGRDNLNVVDPVHYDELDNAERISEVMHLLREGSNLGWPYTYWDPIKKAHMLAPEYGGDNFKRVEPDPYDKPVVAFPGHWAPLQMTLYTGTQFPAKYRGGMFVAFHGSWNRAPRSQAGYKVAFVPFDEKGMPRGTYEAFSDDFAGVEDFTNTRDARFRPAGVAVGPDGSLYIGETEKGRIRRVMRVERGL